MPTPFEVVSSFAATETFAVSNSIRELNRLNRFYGRGRWRKRKGIASVKLPDSTVRLAEIHWYEATGIGKREMKIKCYLD